MTLTQRKQPLTGGDESGERLLQQGERRDLFIQIENSANQTESEAVMDINLTALICDRGFGPDFGEDGPFAESGHQLEQSAAQHDAAGSGLSRRFHGAQMMIEIYPVLNSFLLRL